MSQYNEPRPERPVKIAHLVFGSFFLGIAGLWALTESGHLSWRGSSYLVPVTLLIAGAIGLGASVLSGISARRHQATRTDGASHAYDTDNTADTTEEIR